MQQKLIFLLLLTASLNAISQHSLGLKATGGLSKVSSYVQQSTPEHKIQFDISGNAGIFYTIKMGNKSILGTELLYAHIGGIQNYTLNISSSNTNNFTTVFNRQRISYLSLPIYYGRTFNKCTVNLGFQASMLLASGATSITESVVNGVTDVYEYEYDDLFIDNYDFGARIGIIYKLGSKLSVEGSYYFGVNNISVDNLYNYFAVQQGTIGVRYNLKGKKGQSDS